MNSEYRSYRSAIEESLANIQEPNGEGKRTFLRVYEDSSRTAADYFDAMRQSGLEMPPLAGLPISIKDVFDVKGETTLAGSKALSDAAPSAQDAEILRRLRRAGAIVVGKTNMTEFAFSGLGINPHYGTPANPWRRAERRIPGGSSSGAAISVTDGMCKAAIGTDTGGSVRIPAALCGLVGFKPTARTVPREGTLPLSTSFDSIGPLAHDVATCAQVYAVLAGGDPFDIRKVKPGSLTLHAVTNYVLEGIEPYVAETYEAALERLAGAGVAIHRVRSPVLERLPQLFEQGGIVAAEAYAWHKALLSKHEDLYDPRVSSRIHRGAAHKASDYISLLNLRTDLILQWRREMEGVDAILLPTVPMVAPKIADLEVEAEYTRVNLLMLRNPTIVNALDGCAISLPCSEPDAAPVGLMLAAPGGHDGDLLAIAASIESIVRAQ